MIVRNWMMQGGVDYFEKLFSKGFSDQLVLGEKGNINAKLTASNCFMPNSVTSYTIPTNINLGTVHTIHIKMKWGGSELWTSGTFVGQNHVANRTYCGAIAGTSPNLVYETRDDSGTLITLAQCFINSYTFIDWYTDWIDIMFVRNGSSLKYYANGLFLEEDTNVLGDFQVGRILGRSVFANQLKNCYISDLRIYNIVKTYDEIKTYDTTGLVFDMPFSDGYGNPTEAQSNTVVTLVAGGSNTYSTHDEYHRNIKGCTKVVSGGNIKYYPYSLSGVKNYTEVGGETSITDIEGKVGFGPVETLVRIPLQADLEDLDIAAGGDVLYDSGVEKAMSWQNFRDLSNSFIKCNVTDPVYVKDLYLPYYNINASNLAKIEIITSAVSANIDNPISSSQILFKYGLSGWTKDVNNPFFTHSPHSITENDDENQLYSSIIRRIGNDYTMLYIGNTFPENDDQVCRATNSTDDIKSWTKYLTGGYVKHVLGIGVDGEYDSANAYLFSWFYDNEDQIYKLWYGMDNYAGGEHRVRIGYATSSDTITWTKQNGINGYIHEDFTKSDNGFVCFNVLKYRGAYYAIVSYQYVVGIDVLYSADGINWSTYAENVIAKGYLPRLSQIDNRYYITYSKDTTFKKMQMASFYSPKGLFNNRGLQLMTEGIAWEGNVYYGFLIKWKDGNHYLLYCGGSGAAAPHSLVDVGLATSNYPDLLKY
jgi:hypothetical protein